MNKDKSENNLTKSLNIYDKSRAKKDNPLFNSTISNPNSHISLNSHNSHNSLNNPPNKHYNSSSSIGESKEAKNKFGSSMALGFQNRNRILKEIKEENNNSNEEVFNISKRNYRSTKTTKVSSSLSNIKIKKIASKKKKENTNSNTITNTQENENQQEPSNNDKILNKILEETEDKRNELKDESIIIEKIKEKIPLRIKFPNIKNLEKDRDKLFIHSEKIINITTKNISKKTSNNNIHHLHQSKSLKPEIRTSNKSLMDESYEKRSNCINVEVLTPSPSSEKNNKKKNMTTNNLAHIRDHNIEQENFLSQRRTLCEFRVKDKIVSKSNKKIVINSSKNEIKPDQTYYPKYFLPYEGYGLQMRSSEIRELSEDRKIKKSKSFRKTKNKFLQTTIGLGKIDVGKLNLNK